VTLRTEFYDEECLYEHVVPHTECFTHESTDVEAFRTCLTWNKGAYPAQTINFSNNTGKWSSG